MSETQRQLKLAKIYRDLKVLVIDDFENFRIAIKQMLRSLGVVTIQSVSNGEDAIKYCSASRFDIIICDHNLGDKKSGQQILEELRFKEVIGYDTIFVMVSAETAKDMVLSALEHQPDGYIAKPINKELLQQRLDTLLEQRTELEKVINNLNHKNWPEVIRHCKEAVAAKSKFSTWCLRTQANAHYMENEYQEAKKIYETVLSKRDIGWARLGAGKVAMAQNLFDKAIEDFKSLLARSADAVDAHDWLAATYEKMGQLKAAQNVLEEAVSVSPHSILRQERLARLCIKNKDVERASDAYRATVKLSNNSVHEKPEHYLQLGRCLSDLSDGDETPEGRKKAKEGLRALDKANHKFKDDASARLQSMLIESRIHLGQENAKKASEVLNTAKKMLDEIDATPADQLEMAQTLYRNGEVAEAERTLSKLAETHGHDRAIMDQIEEMLDEPVSLKLKLEARSLNKTGIEMFEQGDIQGALETFRKALKATPKHPALNLNMVQVMMKAMNTPNEETSALITECRACIANVSHIPEQHRQYKRFRHLEKKVAAM